MKTKPENTIDLLPCPFCGMGPLTRQFDGKVCCYNDLSSCTLARVWFTKEHWNKRSIKLVETIELKKELEAERSKLVHVRSDGKYVKVDDYENLQSQLKTLQDLSDSLIKDKERLDWVGSANHADLLHCDFEYGFYIDKITMRTCFTIRDAIDSAMAKTANTNPA